jgi:hypothetical protein
MEPETELDAALVDAFEAETALPSVRREDTTMRRKCPIVGDFRGLYEAEMTAAATPPAAIPSNSDGSTHMMLRHYPSLDAPSPPSNVLTQQPPLTVIRQMSYPRLDPVGVPHHRPTPILMQPVVKSDENLHQPVASKPPSEAPPVNPSMTDRATSASIRTPLQVTIESHERVQSPVTHKQPVLEAADGSLHHPVVSTPKCDASLANANKEEQVDAPNNPPQSLSKVEDQRFPPVDAIIPTDEEMARQRLQLEAEVRRFAQQADYLALALAGDTPHQIEMRRHREQERKARDERRIAAVEARLESMVAREHQREARFDERRQRHAERTHRSSVSPSPERESDTENESKNDALGGDTVGQLA